MKKKDEVRINKLMTKDRIKYYKLHGCVYQHGVIRIFLKDFKVSIKDNFYIFHRDCDWLTEDMKCKGHPDRKPKICQESYSTTDKNIRLEGCIY